MPLTGSGTMTPATPARIEPTTKTSVRMRGRFLPSAMIIAASLAPALMTAPSTGLPPLALTARCSMPRTPSVVANDVATTTFVFARAAHIL